MPLRGPPDRYGSSARYADSFAAGQFGILRIEKRKWCHWQGKKWVATFHTRSDKPFVRKASSGGWRAVLPEKTVTYMEAQWGPLMKQLGYQLSTETEKEASEVTHATQ